MPKSMKRFTPVKFTDVVIDDSFWTPRIRVNREETLPYEYEQCKKTGRIDAFRCDWKPGIEPVPHRFWDSDVYKWVEASSYSLATNPDPKLETLVNGVIDLIAKVQQPDGYVNVYFTVVEPDKRWTNLRDYHELYTAGHLFEAGVAHFQATGSRKLLDVVCRFADYIAQVFGTEPGKKPGYCGHEEIELALIKLYRVTGEKRYLNLSQYFIDQRGQKPYYFGQEAIARGEDTKKLWAGWADDQYAIFQAHLPVREQKEAVGHSVRAMYLYSAMADLAMETGDKELFFACKRLWESACTRKMYLTGGIGSSSEGEKFTVDYDLPNKEAYAETCASIGLVFWNHRMLQMESDNRYADVMERALYNGVMSGVSLDGKKFFYVNPLASSGNHHRQEWFGCACCPPNIARLLASLGQYIYGQNQTEAVVHLYIRSTSRFNFNNKTVVLNQKTDYPRDGKVSISLKLESPVNFGLKLRLPGWCRKTKVRVNNKPFSLDGRIKQGYLTIKRQWQNEDRVQIEFAMPVERIFSHPDVRQNTGKVALQRGPVVYCLEEADNPVPLNRVFLPENAVLKAQFNKNLLGGVVVVKSKALVSDARDWKGTLYRTERPRMKPVSITAVPYGVWDNRKPGQMRVWLRGC
ncbi:MAG: beta-L-arabinofuranosidase domain-containing protein [Candidatus Omnitrophota bacterium]